MLPEVWMPSLLVKNGFRYRDFIGLPIGGKKTIFRMKVQRYKCKDEDCDYDKQEPITFTTGSQTYTHRFATYVVCLLKSMTIRAVSDLLMVGWDTIKDIHMRFFGEALPANFPQGRKEHRHRRVRRQEGARIQDHCR